LILKSNIFGSAGKKEKDLIALEITEVKEISDMIFKRLNRKIQVLEAIENSVDEKLKTLEKLIQKAESLKPSVPNPERHGEIVSLGRKGMKSREIADRLDIPVGEVDLILNLRGIKSTVSN
jgi:DNA-binding NarL/FixJ family response regulator